MTPCARPVMGFCAYSGSGKTTLLRLLIPLLSARGLRVGLVKHAHHDFELDYPGKDSYELRKAGASQVVVASRKRVAYVSEFREPKNEPTLAEALAPLCADQLDLVLVEGFKDEPIPKIELHRPALGSPLICRRDTHVVAVATDDPGLNTGTPGVLLLDLNRPARIADFILDHLGFTHLRQARRGTG